MHNQSFLIYPGIQLCPFTTRRKHIIDLQVAVHEIETMNDTNIETTSGLRINIRKGIMVGVRMELQEEVNKLAYITNCKVDQFPIKYLVLPLGDIQDQN